ncbi:MAG TPA: PQQ-binding-like beta-propeller repeat protein [Thermomicrobiales bacterium]|jgi:outer membrane protein assembly factor BamB
MLPILRLDGSVEPFGEQVPCNGAADRENEPGTSRRRLLGALATAAGLARTRPARADDAPRLVVLAAGGTGPKLTGIGVEEITPNAATVVWTTDEPADSTVEYGPTGDLGQAVTDPAPVTAHRIALTGLTPETTYHYRIRSRSATGIHATGADRTFRTPTDAHLPEEFVGSWTGIGRQSDPLLAMTVAISLDTAFVGAVAGTVRYRSRGCTGELTLVGVVEESVELAERIVAGADVCIDGGRLNLSMTTGGFLKAVWTGPSGDPSVTSLLSRYPIGGDVAMFQADPAHTGRNPGPGPRGSPRVLWHYQTGAQIYATPVVANGVVYVNGFNGTFYALDAIGGGVIWTTPSVPSYDDAAAAVVDGLVIFEVEAFALGAFAALTGQAVWRLPIPGGLGHCAPAVLDGTVFLADAAKTLFAIQATDGAVRWQAAIPKDALFPVVPAPAVDQGIVFLAGGAYGAFYAFDAATGALLWQAATNPFAAVPAVAADTVYAGGEDGLYALDAPTGAMRWRFDHRGCSTPAIVDGSVYFGTDDGYVFALDAADGGERWRFQTGSIVFAAPAVVGSTLYVGGFDGNLYALDTGTGQERWRFALGGSVYSAAVVAGGVIYIGAPDGAVYAIAGSDG